MGRTSNCEWIPRHWQDPAVRVRNWFERQVEREAKGDALSFSDRVGQLFAIAFSVIAIAFVAVHDTRPTGFFTEEFGALAAVLLHGMLVVGMIPAFVKLVTGRKNLARLFEAGSMAVFFVATLCLLVVFPFDFSHFAEPLPRSLEFLLDWVPELLAKWFLAIGVIVGAVMPAYTYSLFLGVRRRLSVPDLAGEEAAQ